jgi:CRP/FNR family cyclic AMP-dependent transcriptional regulator
VGVPLRSVAGSVPRRLPHGEVVTRQGDAVTSLFLVTAGAVRLSAVTDRGREVVVGILGPGDVFGEVGLLGGPSPVEARAIGSAEVVALPLEDLRELLVRHPATAEELLRLIAARLHRTSGVLRDALAADLRTRISRRLHDLAREHGAPEPGGIRLRVPLTQEDLARMVGASREAVNRTLGSLAARGLVRTDGRTVVIPDPEALGERVSPIPGASPGCTRRTGAPSRGPAARSARTIAAPSARTGSPRPSSSAPRGPLPPA